MSFDDIIASTTAASEQAHEAATHAKHTKNNFPGADAKYKEELSLAVASLAGAVQHLAEELRGKGVI